MKTLPVSARRVLIFVLASLPFGWLLWATFTNHLGADPAKTVVWQTGLWALRLLLITLCVSPARRLLQWGWLMVHRRMLGLFALFYAVLHLLAYVFFILGADVSRLGEELIKRPYITVGAPALLILVVLGVTSTRAMMRRLGKSWQRLHNSVYVAVLLAWLHLFWQVRSSYFEAALYGSVTAALLLIRLYWWWQRRQKVRSVVRPGQMERG